MEQEINYTLDVKILKSNIHKLRMMSGMSIADVVNKSKINRESIYRWEDETDQRCPTVESIVDVCNLFNIDIESLLFRELPNVSNGRYDRNNTQNSEDVNRTMFPSFPNAFSNFFQDIVTSLNNKLTVLNGVSVGKVTIIHQGYIALKILKEDNTLNKPLHFLSIFPAAKRRTLRFVFSTSLDNILKNVQTNSITFPESALNLLSHSAMGAAFTLTYRQRIMGKDGKIVEELFIKEKPSLEINFEDVAEICLNVLGLVIDKKKS